MTPVSIFDIAPQPPAYEQPTALYQPGTGGRPPAPAPEIAIHGGDTWPEMDSISNAQTALYPSAAKSGERDWVAIILGILAVVAMLGLIPLWYFVYLAYRG